MSELLFGIHAVVAALKREPERIEVLYLDRGRRDRRLGEVWSLARAGGITTERVERAALDRLCGAQARHQGVAARFQGRPALGDGDLGALLDGVTEAPFLLVLDGVTDPHNLGACLRSAEAAGVHGVITPRDKAAGLTATARKAASGAAERLPFVQVTNLSRTLEMLKDRGIWLVGAAGEADAALYDVDLRGPLALVLGAEDAGLRRLTRAHCDHLARIPMVGGVESLNISVAAGVFLFEARRQRRVS